VAIRRLTPRRSWYWYLVVVVVVVVAVPYAVCHVPWVE
jgi:hypothetical protein